MRRRPVGAVIADICHDLGITPGQFDRAFWDELSYAIIAYGGSLAGFLDKLHRRLAAFVAGDHADLQPPMAREHRHDCRRPPPVSAPNRPGSRPPAGLTGTTPIAAPAPSGRAMPIARAAAHSLSHIVPSAPMCAAHIPTSQAPMQIRNVAIIAHVDHGKTTLVDKLLSQSGSFRDHQVVAERAMDRNDLERERGITILAKCTSVVWHGTRINIVDTPGHADFGGEVERILNMVDGAIVLVDAAEGVLPQTKFVVGKALARGLHPIVVVNKVDRADARADEVHTEIFDLFAALGATDAQLDFPMLYASGRQGWADTTLDGPRKDLSALFDLVVRHVPAPTVDPDAPFGMVATIMEYDPYLGRVLTGRVEQGRARLNMPVKVLHADGTTGETGRMTKLLSFRGLDRVPVEEAEAGDIIAVAGLAEATVPDTIGAPELAAPLPAIPVDPPTLAMTFRINDGPLAGREGKKVTSARSASGCSARPKATSPSR